MMKRIKHISELPTWFNLQQYEFTNDLDSLGWFKQLIARELHYTHTLTFMVMHSIGVFV